MKVYYTDDFEGHWPVGTSAVVVARDRTHATKILKKELENNALGKLEVRYGDKQGKPIFFEVDLNKPNAVIINDGDY